MPHLPPPSALEQVAGSLPAEAALTAIAAAAGTPLAALLPVLGKSLAAERQRQRVERTLQEMNSILEAHGAQLARLTDQQYKFINEVVLALLHTTSESKMAFLKRAVKNSLDFQELPDQEAVCLSRVVRDISAEEVVFVLSNFGFGRIWLNESEADKSLNNALAVKPHTPEGYVVQGLLSLGLITTAEPTWDDSGLLRFTPMAAKLIALLRETGA